MGFCTRCGRQLPEEAYFCPYCGVRTIKGVEAGVSIPVDEWKEAFHKAGQEMEKAFQIAAKEMEAAFKTTRANIRESANRRTVVCPQCGEKNLKDVSFCHNCGKKLHQ
ncbi:MAG: zinc-ribbon domain-containing protein [Candidatus Verstraetearchaeota archaeon]|nr:zinc-ribbon domain-containing protein [Candidatus Verstraetearchaeota archaeon]